MLAFLLEVLCSKEQSKTIDSPVLRCSYTDSIDRHGCLLSSVNQMPLPGNRPSAVFPNESNR